MIPILLFKLPIFTLSSFLSFFMSSYGLIVMALGCCVSGSTAAVHTADVSSSVWVGVPLEAIFSFNSFFNAHYVVNVTNTELRDINQLMYYRDAQWYIKDTWIGFSTRNIAKQAVACCTLMASQVMGCLKWSK